MSSGSSLAGKTIKGCYHVEEKIAKGGMAWVYRARHTGLNEPMAIKVLFPSLVEEDRIRLRFLDEAKILYRLKHPNIVQVTDLLQEENLLGMVLEWVDGQDLKAWVRYHKDGGPLSEVRRMFLAILDAMEYVHNEKYVHRDLKPANILLSIQQGMPVPKITDFGIAKVLRPEDGGATSTGTQMGTLLYMAPEQIRDSKYVDHRADLYALGVILFEMLTGMPPFRGEAHQLMFKHISEAPPSPRETRPSISPALEAIVLKSLSKDPNNRFETCKQWREILEQPGIWDEVEGLEAPKPRTLETTPLLLPDGSLIDSFSDSINVTGGGVAQASGSVAKNVLLFGLVFFLVAGFSLGVGGYFLGWFSSSAREGPEPTPRDVVRSKIGGNAPTQEPKPRVGGSPTGVAPMERPNVSKTQVRPLPRDVEPRPRPRIEPRPETPRVEPRPSVEPLGMKTFRLVSEPAGAMVYEGARKRRATPFSFSAKPGGRKRFVLRKKGYQTTTLTWRLRSSRLSKRVRLRPLVRAVAVRRREVPKRVTPPRPVRRVVPRAPAVVAFVIRSTPGGATVFVNGRRLGRTPYIFRGAAGTRLRVKLQKANYESVKTTLRVPGSGGVKAFRLKKDIPNPFAE